MRVAIYFFPPRKYDFSTNSRRKHYFDPPVETSKATNALPSMRQTSHDPRWPQMNSGVSKITCDQCTQALHSIWFQHTEVTEVVCLVLCVCIKRITAQHYPRTYFQNYPSETVCRYLTPVRVQTRQPRTCLRLLGRQPRFHSPMPGQSGELCQWQYRSNLSVESQWILHIYIESDGL